MLGGLGLLAAFLATQYVFQEPAYVTWSRLLEPEVAWQSQKYPSVRFAFDIVERLITYDDPRDRFDLTDNRPPPAEPSQWTADFVGPRFSDPTLPWAGDGDLQIVRTETELTAALRAAVPGTTILLRPGEYSFSGRSVVITQPGDPEQPIVLRAATLGEVTLRFAMLEGFHVFAPYWVFENLVIEGACRHDWQCEHAFHIVHKARGVVLRNNWITNFDSAIKVNGVDGSFPDGGLIEHNFIANDHPRETSNAVTSLDMVGISQWRIRKNVVADFSKQHGDRTSYGGFFKGAGSGNIFEQNLVRCEWRHAGGIRIGFSFGGGSTGMSSCRDGRCDVEQRNGIARNNIIMDCPNDVGIYLNRSAQTHIHNNLIANTRGIDVRFADSDAVIMNNIIDGRIFARDGGSYVAEHNILGALEAMTLRKNSARLYADPLQGDFRLRDFERVMGKGLALEEPGLDLCEQPYRQGPSDIGPIQYGLDLACTPVLP